MTRDGSTVSENYNDGNGRAYGAQTQIGSKLRLEWMGFLYTFKSTRWNEGKAEEIFQYDQAFADRSRRSRCREKLEISEPI